LLAEVNAVPNLVLRDELTFEGKFARRLVERLGFGESEEEPGLGEFGQIDVSSQYPLETLHRIADLSRLVQDRQFDETSDRMHNHLEELLLVLDIGVDRADTQIGLPRQVTQRH